MWPFSKRDTTAGISARSVEVSEGRAVIDVRGQTCPGYLLAINKAVEPLATGTVADLLITYPPGGEDVKAWCKERKLEYLGILKSDGFWTIQIRK